MAQGKGNPEINKKVATSALVTTILSGVGFYLGNRYWEAVASFGGQFFEHWGDGFALMWPLIAENPLHTAEIGRLPPTRNSEHSGAGIKRKGNIAVCRIVIITAGYISARIVKMPVTDVC